MAETEPGTRRNEQGVEHAVPPADLAASQLMIKGIRARLRARLIAVMIALFFGRYRGNTARHDLAAFRGETLQQLDVFVIDSRHSRRKTGSWAAGKRVAGSFFCSLSSVEGVSAAVTSELASAASARCSRGLSSSSRLRSRSSRLLLFCIITEGPSSCSSTRMLVAQDIFVKAHITFHLRECCRGCIDVHQRIVAFSVLFDPVGERFQAPVFVLSYFAAVVFISLPSLP